MVCSTPDGQAVDEALGPMSQRGQVRVVLRIFRAELTRKFAMVGFTAPFVVVEWVSSDGSRAEVTRTQPNKRGGRRPVWNHEGPGQPSGRHGAGKHRGSLDFQVLSESLGAWARGRPTFCGAVTVSMDDLLGEGCEETSAQHPGPGCPSRAGPVRELELRKHGEVVGSLTVQAMLLHHTFAPSMEWLEEPMAEPYSDCMPSASSQCLGTIMSRHTSAETTGVEAHPVLEPGGSLGSVAQLRSPKHCGSDETMQSAPMSQDFSMPIGEGRPQWWAGSVHSSMSAMSGSQPLRKATHPRSGQRGGRRAHVDLSALTLVDPENFQLPVARLGTSGGTAPFFQLVLGESGDRSPDYFIGKDLTRAEGEVTFYEQVLNIVQGTGGSQASLSSSGLAPLLSYMLEYAGVVECQAKGEAQAIQLLVMRNLRDGCRCLRMLDVKIGERTADAGWQGKSSMSAFKQGLLDGVTTSQSAGFRVEGFDAAPRAFASLDPLLDVSGLPMFSDKDTKKKARRFMLQRMPASEIIMHLVDVHQEPQEPSEGPPCWAPSELAEIALHEMCRRLAGLSVACRRSPIPQKWVGSSVALGFEVGHCAQRDVPEAELRRAVRVNIFDWGRSELLTPERYVELDEAARQDRATFWRYYVGGVDRLAWEVTRCYRHRFGCANGWRSVRLAVYDFDSLSENDFIGQVTLPLETTPEGREVTVALEDFRGRPVRTLFGPQATVTYRIGYREFPAGSRLQGAWRVNIIRAAALPGRDRWQGKSTSDPFAMLTSISQDGRFQFRQQTVVIERDLNPEWNETFEVPVAANPAALHRAFGETAPGLGTAPLGTLLPPDDVSDAEVDKAVQAWVARLDEAADNFNSGGTSSVAFEGRVSHPYCQTPPRVSHLQLQSCSSQGCMAPSKPRLLTSL